jgi:hypothetical protein
MTFRVPNGHVGECFHQLREYKLVKAGRLHGGGYRQLACIHIYNSLTYIHYANKI